jgi:formylglycine-generating enzyme
MKAPTISLLALAMVCGPSAQGASDAFVLIRGGIFRNTKTRPPGTSLVISNFYLCKYEVTQKEWADVTGKNPSKFKGDDLPVETVSWYDCIEYCNQRSAREGLQPYYTIDKARQDPDNHNDIDDVKWTVTINAGANGYRLPTEAEWAYAAGGGPLSKLYTYSGSDDINKVAWYYQNSGDSILSGLWSWPAIENNHNKTKPVGGKEPNELGLYDMSGNVREWCWDWYREIEEDGAEAPPNPAASGRVWRGGGWLGGDFCCESSFRAGFEANGRGPDQGVRLCRGSRDDR